MSKLTVCYFQNPIIIVKNIEIIVIYNTERKGKKFSASFSLETFCVLESVNLLVLVFWSHMDFK